MHLGYACDSPRGLLAPVVRDSDKQSLPELTVRVKEMTATTTGGTISPDESDRGDLYGEQPGEPSGSSPSRAHPEPPAGRQSGRRFRSNCARSVVTIVWSIVERNRLSLTVESPGELTAAPGARFLGVASGAGSRTSKPIADCDDCDLCPAARIWQRNRDRKKRVRADRRK